MSSEHWKQITNMSTLYFVSHRSFIPDEHMVWCPEQLLQCVLAHIHYMPDHWKGSANKSETRNELAQLFQYKAVRLKLGTWIHEIAVEMTGMCN